MDSNVILDIASEDNEWIEWSGSMLTAAAERGAVVINPVIYAEVSARYETIEALDTRCRRSSICGRRCPGRRRSSRPRRSRRTGARREEDETLPDFLHRRSRRRRRLVLFTRDGRRYRTYFPKLQSSHPERAGGRRTART